MKRIIILINIFISFQFLLAQNKGTEKIDSLKIEFKKATTDTLKVNILNEIGSHYFYSNPMMGIDYSEIALNLATKIHWKKGMAVAYNHMGVCNWINQKPEIAIDCFQKSLEYYKELKDQKNIAENHNRLGVSYGECENYNQAIDHFNLAYQINSKINNILQTADNLSGMGDIHYKTKKYQKALEYYIKSNQKYKEVSNIFGMGITSFNMGNILVQQKLHFKALKCYNQALDKFTISKSFYHIGNTYLEIGKANYIYSFENKGEKRKSLELAINNFKEAIRFYTINKAFDKINECNLELSKTYEEIGNYKLALESYKKYIQIDKKYLNFDKENKLAELKTQRKFDAKNNQIQIQQYKIESDTRKVYLLVTITILSAILLVLFLWLYTSKRKNNLLLLEKNSQISNINKQKDKFFSIIAHDLRGPFNGFLGMTEILAEDFDSMEKEEIQFAAINMRDSAKKLHDLLDNLLEWSRMEQGAIPFSPKENNLDEIVNKCIAPMEENARKKEIKIESDINKNLQIFADYHILQSIIRNILSNALKFTPRGGKIEILGNEKNKHSIISIADSGIGMDAKMIENIFKIDKKTNRPGTENEPSTGLGMILCKEFVEKHNGKIWIESEENQGTTFYMSFPKATV